MSITNTNEVTPADAGLEYADQDYTEQDYCDCEHPIETSMPPVYCAQCNRYINPSRLTANGDGSYSIKLAQLTSPQPGDGDGDAKG
jgi:hypothetical protein